jgi:hypothetical protein
LPGALLTSVRSISLSLGTGTPLIVAGAKCTIRFRLVKSVVRTSTQWFAALCVAEPRTNLARASNEQTLQGLAGLEVAFCRDFGVGAAGIEPATPRV